MTTTADHPLLAGLTPEQRSAVTTRASPLCIVAGAGSGKTRVLTRRIAWQVDQAFVDPRRILAVTFTRKAAHELRSRLRGLGLRGQVRAATFHSIALAQLHRYERDQGWQPRPILSERLELIAELVKKTHAKTDQRTMAGLLNEIEWSQARLITPATYAAKATAEGRRPPFGDASRFAQLYDEYQAAKVRRRVVDLSDLLATCLRLMRNRPEHAEAQRWLHQHLLVDEFQDVNPLQFELLKAWLGDASTLVVVGDPDQAIYGWNGAEPELITSVGQHFKGCAVVNLNTNFRSTPEILGAGGRVLGRPPQTAFRPSGIEPTVTVCHGKNEAAMLARAVRYRQQPSAPWRMQAVLARTNAQLAPLRKALTQHGIAVTTRRESNLIRYPEVVALMKAWRKSGNHASLKAVLDDTRIELLEAQRNGKAEGTFLTWARLDGANLSSPKLELFFDYAEDHLALDPDATVRSFLADLRFGDHSLAEGDGVDLLTFHAAKGLEWPIVHLVGLEDGFVPAAKARSKQARAEERRLLYVAVTRAVRELHVMWCDQRIIGDRLVQRKPSPWLKDIVAPDIVAPAVKLPQVDMSEAFARARRHLEMAGSAPPPVRPGGRNQQSFPI